MGNAGQCKRFLRELVEAGLREGYPGRYGGVQALPNQCRQGQAQGPGHAQALDIAARYLVYKLHVPGRILTESWRPSAPSAKRQRR